MFDGTNVWPAFTGGARLPAADDLLLRTSARAAASGKCSATKLFDLEADPGETTDLAAKHPEVRDRLAREVREWATSVGIEADDEAWKQEVGR